MYPAFSTTRPRLPSILSVFRPIEQYQAELSKEPLVGDAAVGVIGPLDAYLAHLLLDVYPGEPAILDLAAEATAGASTLVSLFHPRQPRVHAVGGPSPGDRRSYRGVVEQFVKRQDKDCSTLRWLTHDELTEELQGETDAVVFVTANSPNVDLEVEHWLNILPSAIVLVFGLGPVGECATLDALLQRFPTGSKRRLALLRESGDVLSASTIGFVAERDNAAVETALRRLKQLFTNNYSILGLLRTATEQAIRDSGSDKAVRESKGFFLEWNHEINQLKKDAQHARENAAAAEELISIKNRLSYRLSEQCRRWRQRLAPDRSWRNGLLQFLRRFAGVCRREGISGLLRRIARRCFRRNT